MNESPHGAPIRIGVVGAGRSRNGIGPFLARACERAGARVVAVAGRNAERSASNAIEIGHALGHDVASLPDVRALCASGIDALVIASPADSHLAALREALEAGVSCLCEKPVAPPGLVASALPVIAGFGPSGLLLMEDAQWPYALRAIHALHGQVLSGSTHELSMGLSPWMADPRVMVEESLPHLISMAFALAPVAARGGLGLRHVHGEFAKGLARVDLELRGPGASIRAKLELRQCIEQPRPAWFSVDGFRADRRIGKDYSISFVGGGTEVRVEDPMHALVSDFVTLLRAPAIPERSIDRGARVQEVALRLRLFGDVMARLFG